MESKLRQWIDAPDTGEQVQAQNPRNPASNMVPFIDILTILIFLVVTATFGGGGQDPQENHEIDRRNTGPSGVLPHTLCRFSKVTVNGVDMPGHIKTVVAVHEGAIDEGEIIIAPKEGATT